MNDTQLLALVAALLRPPHPTARSAVGEAATLLAYAEEEIVSQRRLREERRAAEASCGNTTFGTKSWE